MMKLHRAVIWYVGSSKLAGRSATGWDARFVRWGYPAGAAAVIGAIEILGGLGLLVPRIRRYAAMMLIAVMVGALATHLPHAEFLRMIPPLVFGGLAALLTRR